MIGRSEEKDYDFFTNGIGGCLLGWLLGWLLRLFEDEMTKDQGTPLHSMEFYSPLRVAFILWIPLTLLVWICLSVTRGTLALADLGDGLAYGVVFSALVAPVLTALKARENFRRLQRGVRSWLR